MTSIATKPAPFPPPTADPRGEAPTLPVVERPRADPWTEAATWLRSRGVESEALAWFALGLAGAAAVALYLAHPGVGGVVGIAALACGELSLVRPGRGLPAAWQEAAVARALNPLVDVLLVAGLLGGLAWREPPVVFALGLLALVVLAWLDVLAVLGPSLRLAPTAGLWTRGDRMGVLLVGAGLGRPGPALLLIVLVGALDAVLRIERADRPPGVPPLVRWPWIEQLLRADGSLLPLARWGSLAVTLLLLLVLPQSSGWRF